MEAGGEGTTATWISKHRPMYDRATRHPFILSIRDGCVDFLAFKRWLAQDYIFVRELVPYVASVLIKACKQSDGDASDMETILAGMASLNDELPWFKKEASRWGIHLSTVCPGKTNLDYCRFLQSLMQPEVNYTVAITAFWALETVYQESFSLCLESDSRTHGDLLGTCQRWGSPEFGQYCRSLQKIADKCLEKAPDDLLKKAEDAFISVLEHEINFWNMSSAES